MTKNRPICADCGKELQESEEFAYNHGRCHTCFKKYATCIRCTEFRLLEDMRQSYCVDCRREYDRDRWARQRAARGVR